MYSIFISQAVLSLEALFEPLYAVGDDALVVRANRYFRSREALCRMEAPQREGQTHVVYITVVVGVGSTLHSRPVMTREAGKGSGVHYMFK